MEPIRVVVMHHNDLDGRASAAIIRKMYPAALCYEVTYDKELPIDKLTEGDKLFIVDFTPSAEADWMRILNVTKDVIWIDHHTANIKKHKFYDMSIEGLRVDTKPSGAGATWQYLFPDVPAPDAVTYTSDYDTWTYDYGLATKTFEAGMSALDYTPQGRVWMDLLSDDKMLQKDTMQLVQDAGRIVIEYRKRWNTDVVNQCAFGCEFEGYKVIACNAPNVNSTLFDSIPNKNEFDILSVFKSTGDKIIVSLYSEDESVNCAELAQKHGGGGHPGAAGFECQNLPFINIQKLGETSE